MRSKLPSLVKRLSHSLILPLIATILHGCANFSPFDHEPVAIQTYTLAANLPEQKVMKKNGPVITVYATRVNPIYDKTKVAYSTQDFSISYYAYNEWVTSPGAMLAPLIRDSLERSGHFSAVVPNSSRNLAELAIDTELVKLRHQYEDGTSYGHLVLFVQLIDLKKREIIATQKFEEKVQSASKDPIGGIRALNMAVEQGLAKITNFTTENTTEYRR